MQALLPSATYHDENIFLQELEHIFARRWHFAGFYSTVAKHNDYLVAEVARKSVVVQNFDGDLRCFRNVCSHRFCEIRSAPRGNHPLRCPYHGWTYDANGMPAGIPHRPRFDGLTPECLSALALPRYRVERCGELVFVCLDPEAASLRESIGGFWAEIETLSNEMQDLIDVSDWDLQCNWKVFVENTLEGYHLDFVHPESFSKLKLSVGDWRFDAQCSSLLARTGPETKDPVAKRFGDPFSSRPLKPEGYFHLSLFPLFLMATYNGVTTSVQQIVPVSAGRTLMKSHIFHRRPDPGSRMPGAMLAAAHKLASDFSRQVLEEDRVICEGVQKGSRQVDAMGMLSDEEIRIQAFQRLYLEAMAGAGVACLG